MTTIEQKIADIINVTLGESLELNGSEFTNWPHFNEETLKIEPVAQRDRIARNAAIYTAEKIAQALAIDLKIDSKEFFEACVVSLPASARAKQIEKTLVNA